MYNPPDPGPFNALVWAIVRQIPAGRVSTYGQIASMIPPPEGIDLLRYRRLGARWVGGAMRAAPSDPDLPWHRVINSQGAISLPKGSAGAEEQRHLLEMEDVAFNEAGRVDFEEVGWEGPPADWLDAHGLLPPRSLRKSAGDGEAAQLNLF